jgi:hypothetical protein
MVAPKKKSKNRSLGKHIELLSAAPIKPKAEVLPKKNEDKIKTLLEMLGLSNDVSKFWVDKNGFGDIVGVVPINRTKIVKLESRFTSYDKPVDETFAQFVVIDVNSGIKTNVLSRKDEQKKHMLDTFNIKYIVHADINHIYQEVLNIA